MPVIQALCAQCLGERAAVIGEHGGDRQREGGGGAGASGRQVPSGAGDAGEEAPRAELSLSWNTVNDIIE